MPSISREWRRAMRRMSTAEYWLTPRAMRRSPAWSRSTSSTMSPRRKSPSAVVTPPDPISQTMLAVPIILLYEISIWCVKLIEIRRKREEDEAGTDVAVV